MQVSRDEIIFIVVFITSLFLVAAGTIMLYVHTYNRRKRAHIREKDSMHESFTRQLLEARMEMQEQAFYSISEEIHDNVGQVLSLASVQLGLAQSKLPGEPLLVQAKNNIDAALRDLRDIAKSLNGGYLQQLSLLQFIRRLQRRINRSGFIRIETETQGQEGLLTEQVKIIVFRILQECVQNVLKHAGASRVLIRTFFEPKQIRIIFEDDGRGFNPEENHNADTRGLGLQNMRLRIGLIHGSLNIRSAPGKGTQIAITVPYE